MIDTLKATLMNECSKLSIERHCTPIQERVNPNTGEIFHLYDFNGFKVQTFSNGVYIGGSSLHKFAKGDNIGTFTLDECNKAIEELESNLHTSIHGAKLSRLDIGVNVPTFNKFPSFYFGGLLELSRMERLERKYSLTYENETRTKAVVVYDKVAECKKKRISIPPSISDYTANVLRFESRLLKPKAVQKTLGIVSISDILDTGNKAKMKDYVCDTWRSIHKQEKTIKAMMKDVKSMKDLMCAMWIKEHGTDRAVTLLRELSKGVTKQQTYRMKKEILELASRNIEIESNTDMEELNERFFAALEML